MGEITRRGFLLGSASALGISALSACGNPAALPSSMEEITPGSGQQPNTGGVLYFGLSTDPTNFDPHVSEGTASDYLRQLTYNSLLQYDGEGVIRGDLAEQYGWSDRQTYKVKLKRGVEFHNGSTLTAEDVVYSFRRMLDPKTAASSASMLKNVSSIEAADDTTVVFHLKRPDVALPFALASATSTIASKSWMESGGNPKTNVMGTGPFTLVERIPGVTITYTRFDDYFDGELPYLNGVVFQPMEDDYSRVTALRTATVDMIDYVPATHVDVITSNPQLRFASDKNFGFGFVGFVNTQPPLDDVRVRKAIALGIDRSSVLETAFLGHGRTMTGSLMPEAFAPYASELDGAVEYDPEQAKSLLKQAGHQNLKLPVVTTSSYSVISRPAEAMLPSLRESGIDVELVQQEWLTFRSTVDTHKFPAHAWGTAPDFGHPAALDDLIGSGGAFAGYLKFKDDRLDSLLRQGRSTIDDSVRNEIYLEAERRALELMPMTYTVRREQGEAYQGYVKGYEHPPKGAWTGVALRRAWMEKTQ